jgi:hypothetical protein
LAVQTAAVPLNLLPFAAIPTNHTAPTCSLTNAKQATITVAQQSARDFLTL